MHQLFEIIVFMLLLLITLYQHEKYICPFLNCFKINDNGRKTLYINDVQKNNNDESAVAALQIKASFIGSRKCHDRILTHVTSYSSKSETLSSMSSDGKSHADTEIADDKTSVNGCEDGYQDEKAIQEDRAQEAKQNIVAGFQA